MSIYASMPALHSNNHATTPLAYQGSNHLPMHTDERRGWVGLGSIPNHIERDGRRRPSRGRPFPYLRLSVNGETVVLTRAQVRKIRDSLTMWLDAT